MNLRLDELNTKVWLKVEESLIPLPEGAKKWGLWHYIPSIWLLPIGIAVGTITMAFHTIGLAFQCCTYTSPNPLKNFSLVLDDSRLWDKIENIREKTSLGKGNPNFFFGTSTCTYQDSGSENCPRSQWADWEKQCLPENNRSGKSADLFSRYATEEGQNEIIDRLKKLGANSYRFSLEWSHIEPNFGQVDYKKLEVYVDFCKALRWNGIAPMVTLHHFSEPKWFHELGSFEKEENIDYFIGFAKTIFPYITQSYWGKPLVEHICTINEPGIEAFSRYVRGAFSPGYRIRFERAGKFLLNALKAHTIAYHTLKKIKPRIQIGAVHQYLKFIPSNPLLIPITRYLNELINNASLRFFREGVFQLKVPFLCNIEEQGFEPKTDFVGLQYYARPVIGLTGSTSYHEPMTQMPFREDPEGIYEAIINTHRAYRAPVIITENGISTHDSKQRSRYMERVLYAAGEAAKLIGLGNLLGYYAWSFCNNFEWNMGMRPQAFGAYGSPLGQLPSKPKEGMEPYTEIAAKSHYVEMAV